MSTPSKVTPSSNNPEVQKLRHTIQVMDNYSQHEFSQIEAIAKLALSRLETPEGYNEIEDICRALEAIRERAHEVQNYINGEAGQVGCGYTDDAERRCCDALIAYEKESLS